jgi:bifunctional oligoribonuclease and PAP phosphatase NrnA
MELSPKQQIAELIKNNQRILIVGHKNHGGDLLGSMLALESVLITQGKEVALVLSETIDQTLLFLPGVDRIQKDVPARDLVIQIDKTKNAIEKIAYNEDNGLLNIVISPKSKLLSAKDLKIIAGNYNYDLVIILDTPDVEKIDSIYDKYTELFFEVPIVNIDHHSGNEYFGTVNLVDMTATSTAEILVSIIEAMGPNHFDADVATCLLTGLIADTASFKNTNTTPKALTISAQMLAAGARQQEIIQNLYKTRPLQTLKLWGKVLSNIDYDSEHRMVISAIKESEITDSSAAPEAVKGVLDELLASAPGTDVVFVLTEEKGKLVGFLKGLNGQDVLSLAEKFGGHGNVLGASFSIPNATFDKDKDNIISKMKALRSAQLGKENLQSAQAVQKPTPSIKQAVEISPTVIPQMSEIKESESSTVKEIEEAPKQVEASEKIVVEIDLEASSVEDLNELLSIEKAIESETQAENDLSPEEFFAEQSEMVPVSLDTEKASAQDDIETALLSIDNEIETGGTIVNEITPNIDIEDTKDRKESLRQLGEVMRGYTPGKALDEKGNQPINTKIWK